MSNTSACDWLPDCSVVPPYPYTHTLLAASEKGKLKEKGVTHVLSIHDTAEPQFPEVSCAFACAGVSCVECVLLCLKEFEYKCIKVSDTSYTNL